MRLSVHRYKLYNCTCTIPRKLTNLTNVQVITLLIFYGAYWLQAQKVDEALTSLQRARIADVQRIDELKENLVLGSWHCHLFFVSVCSLN